MKQEYKSFAFRPKTIVLITTMNAIVSNYQKQGFVLTVRQLYYQLVSQNIVPNTEKSYKLVTSVVNDARLAGLMDWDGIEDRTRSFVRRNRWNSPADILRAVSKQYHEDLWVGQEARPFVIVEKEALAGVLERVCNTYDVPLLAARGYPSGTVLREFAETDIIPVIERGQNVAIIHLGDHDPSGIDMTRDLTNRFEMFSAAVDLGAFNLQRIALTMGQIQAQKPPPNPAKSTDARFASYRSKFGSDSWELDALKPAFLVSLVEAEIKLHITNASRWKAAHDKIEAEKKKLVAVADKWK